MPPGNGLLCLIARKRTEGYTQWMISGAVILLRDRGHPVISIRAPINDEELMDLSGRVTVEARTNGHKVVVLDLSGLDVLDSFSVHALGRLSDMLRLCGASTAFSGISPGAAVTLAQRGLHIGHQPIAVDVEDALNRLN